MNTRKEESYTILGIESSCDDTAAAVTHNTTLLSNVIASQSVHEEYGGVVPELASRAHQKNIVAVVDTALKRAEKSITEIDAIAYTRGPGLLGSLLVGISFAKGVSVALNKPLIEVNHLQGHVLSHFLQTDKDEVVNTPQFPFLCLLVSGGNSQIIVVKNHLDMEVIGQTIDDAAGEAFDKSAKIMGLPYPGGPHIDKLAEAGNPLAYAFAKPKVPGLDYSFSGLKTSFLYHLKDNLKRDSQYIAKNKQNLCASLQKTIIDILTEKLILATKQTGIKTIVLAGGVSANGGLRNTMERLAEEKQWNLFLPPRALTTDNAAMIAVTGYFKLINQQFGKLKDEPFAKMEINI